MGLSSTQARFLQLTGRKSNVEYQGQQINQSRVALGNQSASYYQQLYSSTVPTPPSVDEYTKVVYSFNDGRVDNEITFMQAKQNGEYMVSYKTSARDDFAIVKDSSNIATRVMAMDENNVSYYEKVNKQKDYQYLANSEYHSTAYMTRMMNHILPPGNYTTSDGQNLVIYAALDPAGSGDIDTQDWSKHQDYIPLRDVYTQIAADPDSTIIQQLIDLLYDTRQANPNNVDRKNTPEDTELVDRFRDIVENQIAQFFTEQFMIGSRQLRTMGEMPEDELRNSDPYLRTLSDDEIVAMVEEELLYLEKLNSDDLKNKYNDDRYAVPIGNPDWDKPGDDGGDWLIRYVQNTSTGAWEPEFYREAELRGIRDNYRTFYDENNNSASGINFYKVSGDTEEIQEIKGVPARLEHDGTGRYSSITLNPGTEFEQYYSLTTNTVKDELAYESAMNQYNFDKHWYDDMISSVNAKIKNIQAQDRNLEIKLKQCDTEQRAIQTEMEAITKIVEKNVESTFKTFG